MFNFFKNSKQPEQNEVLTQCKKEMEYVTSSYLLDCLYDELSQSDLSDQHIGEMLSNLLNISDGEYILGSILSGKKLIKSSRKILINKA